MRATALVTTVLLLAIPLAALMPQAGAVGYCTSVGVVTRECAYHHVCIGGGGYGTIYERCQYSEKLCEWLIHCWPGPVLP